MFSFKIGSVMIHFNPVNLKKLFSKIYWSNIVFIAIVISAIQLLFMDIYMVIQSVAICALVSLVSYYYLLLYCRVCIRRKVLGVNYVDFWTRIVRRNHSSSHQIKVVFFEEMFFRVAPVYILALFNINNIFWIGILTIIFVFTHVDLNRQNHLLSLIELFIFFFLITLIYRYYIFLPILLIPHFIRNLFIDEAFRYLKGRNV